MAVMHRLRVGGLDSGRQIMRPCPRCGEAVGLWLRQLDVEEAAAWRAVHSFVPQIVSRDADPEKMGALVPWVCCLLCGFDDSIVFGDPEVPYVQG